MRSRSRRDETLLEPTAGYHGRRVIAGPESDSHLVAMVQTGDERAFDVIFERYRSPLLAYCRAIVGEAAAQDAVQQALMCAWYSLHRGREVRHLRPWLFTIARRAALEAMRANPPLGELTERDGSGGSSSEPIEHSARARAALAAVAELPPRERDALVWTSLHGRSGREAARALGVSEGALRQLVVRARARARAGMQVLVPPAVLAPLGAIRAPWRAATLTQRASALGPPLEGAHPLLWLAPVLAAGALIGTPAGTPHHVAHARAAAPSSDGSAHGATPPTAAALPTASTRTAARTRGMLGGGVPSPRQTRPFGRADPATTRGAADSRTPEGSMPHPPQAVRREHAQSAAPTAAAESPVASPPALAAPTVAAPQLPSVTTPADEVTAGVTQQAGSVAGTVDIGEKLPSGAVESIEGRRR